MARNLDYSSCKILAENIQIRVIYSIPLHPCIHISLYKIDTIAHGIYILTEGDAEIHV